GKFYMYCPIHGNGIGVLVADSPYGPFKDPLGHALVWQKEHWNDIDPTVFIDDDGQAYMYWGNPDLYHVKLNEDMISYSGDIIKHPHIEDYQEGPWFYKRNGHYYLAFASTCCPEGIGYAMSNNPEGPWEYKGHIMNHTPRTRGNHPGIIDYKGKSYVFGLNYDILRIETPDHHERRSVSYAEMHYNADGTIQEVPYWKDNNNKQVGTFNPYQRVQAETMAWGYGLKTKVIGNQIIICNVDDGETLMLKGVDFGKKAKSLFANLQAKKDCIVEIRLDSKNGTLVGCLNLKAADGFADQKCKINGAKGIHDLYFCFKGEGKDLLDFNYWQMKK
ncbi:MAG: family 43 glycosylhydrolase, partial [Prevotellaceae bacterium]|nr:family 43 glycosylhydrolase [Prevotellaceae bacterium]